MIKQFAGVITSFLMHENIIEENDQEIYQYGTEQILINLTILLIIGIITSIMSAWTETFFFLIGMLPIRAIAGGFHASTPVKCNVLTVSVFFLNIVLINILKEYMTFYLLFVLLSFILFSIIRFAPVDHQNKVLEGNELMIAKKKSRIIGIVIFFTCIGFSLKFNATNIFVISIMMGTLTASISLIIGSIKRGGERNENNEYLT